MKPPTKVLDPDLARFCQELADVAALCGDATHALLINANRLRFNLDLPRGGAVLLLRFPAAAVGRAAPDITELLTGQPLDPPSTFHPNEEPPPCGEVTP